MTMLAPGRRVVNLPLELKYEIISMLDTPSLAATCSTNSALSREAERYLYSDVHISDEKQIKSFMYAIERDPRRAKRVNSCTISDFDIEHRALVHDVLQAMSNLRSLAIIPNIAGMELTAGWDALLEGCDFKLLEFITSFDCDRALTDFLITQTHIERYIHSGYTPTHSTDLLHDPHVLPSLKHFHGNIMDLNIIIPHRPVTHVTVQETIAQIGLTLFVLRPLRDSKGPIEFLSLCLMDPVNPAVLEQIHAHTPHLSTLDLCAPRRCQSESSWCSALEKFKRLDTIKYETACNSECLPNPVPVKDQETLVQAWFSACPLLRTVEFTAEVLTSDEDEYMTQTVEVWKLQQGKWRHVQEERTEKGW